MATALTDIAQLNLLLSATREWLLVRGDGTSCPVNANEVEVSHERDRTRVSFVADNGFKIFGLQKWAWDKGGLELQISGQFGRYQESIRLIPRTSAGELLREVEFARLERAGEIARMVAAEFPHLRLKRVALRAENGRLAEAIFGEKNDSRIVLLADVTEKLTAESLLATALLRFDRSRMRSKKPVTAVWIAGPKKQARALQKLRVLLRPAVQDNIQIIQIETSKEPVCRTLRFLRMNDLWREKPTQLVLPSTIAVTTTASRIASHAADQIDIIHSKQGETIRFLGLPFARVRTVLGRERAWFGIERVRVPLTEDTAADLSALVQKLDSYRRNPSANRRHRHYQLSPESWLESILLRNIKLLDANLILSPIYNQFRASNDQIDLLALRRDGRLVIVEIKTAHDREMVFQAADYWRKIELRRRRGQLAKAFGDLEILDKPALVYAVAPALSFHRDFDYFARKLAPEIELWRFELHEDWRREIKVIGRKNYNGNY